MTNKFFPLGTAAGGQYRVAIDAEKAGWRYSGIHVAKLAAGGRIERPESEYEWIAVPISGQYTITVEGEEHQLNGRDNVFASGTDVLYVPRDTTATISSASGGEIAFPAAKAQRKLSTQYLAAADTPIATRGSGNMTRSAREFCMAGGIASDRLLALEVITPSGNWSGYPPHKHDTTAPDPHGEVALEEIYYFRVSDAPDGPGFAYQRVFTDDHSDDLTEEVHSGDVMTIARGWHGPSIAPPGYDLYYLNAMAGDERDWRSTTEPRTRWILDCWGDLPVDPRVHPAATA